MSIRRLATFVAVIVAASCQPAQVGSRYVKSQAVDSNGSTITVSQTDSQALQGAQLQIEPGSLEKATTITLEVGLTDLAETGTAAGPVAVWEPSGLKFGHPAKMTLPFKLQPGQSESDLQILVVEADGSRSRIARSALAFDADHTHVTFMVAGFTGFQPMAGAACTTDADCAPSEVCSSGRCLPSGGAGGGAAGGTAQCTPTGETCNGVDDDCDGIVDDGATCPSGQTCNGGACANLGAACVTVRDCDPVLEDCVNGYCVSNGGAGGGAGGAGGASGGTGGASGGTGGASGGSSGCGTCAAGETCWGGQCQLIACDPVRGCPSPLTCVNNSCQ